MVALGDQETWYNFNGIRIAKEIYNEKTKDYKEVFTLEEATQIYGQIGKRYDPKSEDAQQFDVLVGTNGDSRTIRVVLDIYGHVTPPPKKTNRLEKKSEIKIN